MNKRSILVVLFILITIKFIGQSRNKNNTWKLGVGFSITKFSEKDVAFIGDKYQFQIPRVNLTVPINRKLSVDGALSFNTIDNAGLIENSKSYFSMDASLIYKFEDLVIRKLYPYVFTGGSLVKSELKMTPTLNIGAGATYWITKKIGVNSQLYYKHSLESFSSMRSHLQGTLGIVFDLNWKGLFKEKGRSTSSCYYDQHK